MAKDITVRVTGQNPDGTMNIQQVGGGDGNPFAMTAPGAGGAMTTAQPAGGFPVRINGVVINFQSEADALKAQNLLRDMQQNQIPEISSIGGRSMGGGGGTGGWIRNAADAASAAGAYLAGRGIRSKIEDARDAVADQNRAISELEGMQAAGKYTDLIPTLLRLARAERDATESHIDALGDQLTALDMTTGAGIAKITAEVVSNNYGSNGNNGNNGNNALLLAGGGLGLGLLLGNNNDNGTDGRRRRRR